MDGITTHRYAVEKGVSRTMQLNLDVVVHMHCADLHVNVQDAAGDRILAGETLKKDPTQWKQWTSSSRDLKTVGLTDDGTQNGDESGDADHPQQLSSPSIPPPPSLQQGGGDKGALQAVMDVHDYLSAARSSRKFRKTPKIRSGEADACRIFGSLEGNKVQGDFHITARGHGYMEFGSHLDHNGTISPSPSLSRLFRLLEQADE